MTLTTKLLLIVLIFTTAKTVTTTSEPKKNCILTLDDDTGIRNVTAKPGEQFFTGCSGRCTCDKSGSGGFGCVPVCAPYIVPPICHYVRKIGDCCKSYECSNVTDLVKKCQTTIDEDSASNINNSTGQKASPAPQNASSVYYAPWHVGVRNNGANSKNCSGILVSRNYIYAPVNCANNKSLIRTGVKDLKIKSVKPHNKVNTIAIIELMESYTITPTLQAINFAPSKAFCDSVYQSGSNCIFYISYYDTNAGKSGVLPAHVVPCQNSSVVANVKCLEVKAWSSTTKHNKSCQLLEAGRSVSIKIGKAYYLLGTVIDGHKCENGKSSQVPFADLCSTGAAESFGKDLFD